MAEITESTEIENLPAPDAENEQADPFATGLELRPTERETYLLETLYDWRESSPKTAIVLGQPLRS